MSRWTAPARAMMVGALLLGTIAATCGDPTPPALLRAGVTLQGDRVTALYVVCPDERVTDVRLYTGEGVIVGDKDDTVLWRISAEHGAAVEAFPIGSVPRGFVERKPFNGNLPKSDTLSFTISSTRQKIAARPFKVRGLEPEMVLSYPGRLMPLNEFLSRGERQCG
jgi:hypothetical protein